MSEWMNERNPTNKGNERTNQLNELKNQQTNKRLVTARRNKWRTNAALKHNSSALKRQLNWTELNPMQNSTEPNAFTKWTEEANSTDSRQRHNDVVISLSLSFSHPSSFSFSLWLWLSSSLSWNKLRLSFWHTFYKSQLIYYSFCSM